MSTADEFDVGPATSQDSLARLTALVKKANELQDASDALEADAKAIRRELYKLVGHFSIPNEGQIPALMVELGLDKIEVAGCELKLEDKLLATFPRDPEKRAAAIAWLEANEGGELLKTSVGLEFARSQHNEALGLAADLREDGFDINVESTVNTGSLKSFIRERLKAGEDVDLEVLGATVSRVGAIKRPKT